MRAAFGLGSCGFELREVPKPVPENGQARIRVEACGICGSDKNEHRKETVAQRISGHEVSGIVEEIAGPEACGVSLGSRVSLSPLWHCGACRHCQSGRTSFCLNPGGVLGYGKGGGFAEEVAVPVRTMIPIPDGLSPHQTCMTEPLAVAVRAAGLVDVGGQNCTVFGAGTIGLLLGQVLRVRGAHRVWVVDIDTDHLAIAEALGLTPVQAQNEDIWAELAEDPPGVVFDAVGHVPSIAQKALGLVARDGACVFIGPQDPNAVKASGFERKKISLLYSVGVHISEMAEAVRLMADGQVDVGPLQTGTYPLDQIESAFQAARKGIKVILEP